MTAQAQEVKQEGLAKDAEIASLKDRLAVLEATIRDHGWVHPDVVERQSTRISDLEAELVRCRTVNVEVGIERDKAVARISSLEVDYRKLDAEWQCQSLELFREKHRAESVEKERDEALAHEEMCAYKDIANKAVELLREPKGSERIDGVLYITESYPARRKDFLASLKSKSSAGQRGDAVIPSEGGRAVDSSAPQAEDTCVVCGSPVVAPGAKLCRSHIDGDD